MKELTKEILTFIEAFVLSRFTNFADVSGAKVRAGDSEKARAILQRLFSSDFISLEKQDKIATAKGAKATSHNGFDDDYIRIVDSRVKCPMIFKPIFSDGKLLTFYAVADTTRTGSHAQIESFCLVYLSKAVSKHDDYEKLSISATARQVNEDIGNNTRAKLKRISDKAQESAAKVEKWAKLSEAAWSAVRDMLSDEPEQEDFIDAVSVRRAELAKVQASA